MYDLERALERAPKAPLTRGRLLRPPTNYTFIDAIGHYFAEDPGGRIHDGFRALLTLRRTLRWQG